MTRSRTVTWEDPAAIAREGVGLTGLEYMRGFASRRWPRPPIASTIEMEGTEFDEGRAVFTFEPAEYHYNPNGTVHGGVAATLLDSAMSCAVHTTLGVGDRYTTLELKVNFVRAITIDTGRVRAEGKVVHRGGTIATAEGRLIAERDGKLLAHGVTTCLIMQRVAPPLGGRGVRKSLPRLAGEYRRSRGGGQRGGQ
jgi:uncharacterized protein (TIGR00369 family)